MRSLFTRLSVACVLGFAVVGCGTQTGNSVPVGGSPNSAGGGVVPVSQQNPASGTEAGLLVDGGTKTYSGFNTTAVDTLLTTPAMATDTTAKTAPADVAGAHSIVYTGNGMTQQIFKFSGGTQSLLLPTSTPGDILPVDYGAIVFYATPPTTASSLSIELTGGSGTSAYDVRIACTGTAVTGRTQTTRYLCALPAYGATSTQNIVNPVVGSYTTGTFTPTAATLYLVVNDSAALATTSTGNTLGLDYVFAEQGTT